MLRITAQKGTTPEVVGGRLRLEAERAWVITGEDAADLDALEAVRVRLPAHCVERIADALRVRFTNQVGHYHLPSLPVLEVVSGKWGDADYESMLGEIATRVAGLPFTAGTGAGLPYDRTLSADPSVVYHAYVYLRHILSAAARPGEQLVPALRAVLRNPHRCFERQRRQIELHRATRADVRTARSVVLGKLVVADPAAASGLAGRLQGHLPLSVNEPTVRQTLDVPENRFVKAFVDQCLGILDTVHREARTVGGAFGARVDAEAEVMMRALQPVMRASLWDEVGTMTRLPVESTVLQRRHGYRDVLRHFVRLRMTTRIPFDEHGRDLLEVKDIAALYEIWCFFQVEAAVTAACGRPTTADAATTTLLQLKLGYDLCVTWPDGTQLFYSASFSRSRPKVRRSYSLPLRPDIALRTSGRWHVLDAKFRLKKLEDADMPESEDDFDDSAERRGEFKRADVYKMHTYRDALNAQSAWVLYPGDRFDFFDAMDGTNRGADPASLSAESTGVGAVPLVPGKEAELLRVTIERLLGSR